MPEPPLAVLAARCIMHARNFHSATTTQELPLIIRPWPKFAELQAGFPTLGTGGRVFRTEVDLGGGNPYADPNYIPYTFFEY